MPLIDDPNAWRWRIPASIHHNGNIIEQEKNSWLIPVFFAKAERGQNWSVFAVTQVRTNHPANHPEDAHDAERGGASPCSGEGEGRGDHLRG